MRRDVFQAIADPTRRAIITLNALQAMTPNALAERFDIIYDSLNFYSEKFGKEFTSVSAR